jgi:NAD(P)-dependent dehydrogenase (short-subunit alcohol dehydrogenase family)
VSEAPDLAGELALVTGGARRIGQAIVLALARSGADVLVHYRTSSEEAQATAKRAGKHGVEAWPVQADLGEDETAQTLLDRAEQTAGGTPSLLVNNASAFPQTGLAEVTREDLADAVTVNAWTPLALTRALADRLPDEEGAGSVVNLTDARVGDAERARTAYALSKDLLTSITRLTARQLAPTLRVNGVAPGPILPPSEGDEAGFEAIADATPLGRSGRPEEIADTVAHLLASGYVTGTVVPVDGGQRLSGGVRDG